MNRRSWNLVRLCLSQRSLKLFHRLRWCSQRPTSCTPCLSRSNQLSNSNRCLSTKSRPVTQRSLIFLIFSSSVNRLISSIYTTGYEFCIDPQYRKHCRHNHLKKVLRVEVNRIYLTTSSTSSTESIQHVCRRFRRLFVRSFVGTSTYSFRCWWCRLHRSWLCSRRPAVLFLLCRGFFFCHLHHHVVFLVFFFFFLCCQEHQYIIHPGRCVVPGRADRLIDIWAD